MAELKYSMVIFDLHSNRHEPWGYEDAWTREYEKEKTETTDTDSLRVGLGGGARKERSVQVEEKAKGSKSYPYFRFARTEKDVDEGQLSAALSHALWQALKEGASFIGGRGTELTKARLTHVRFVVNIDEIEKPSETPTCVPVILKGAFGGMQWQYFERIPRVKVSGTVSGPVSKEWLERGLGQLDGLRFGPTRRAHIVLE